MATERLNVGGECIETLTELLRPGLSCVLTGINPSPTSVAAGHYYQGRLGKRLWSRLQEHGITGPLTPGSEDTDAFAEGIGFADVVRRPTASAEALSATELQSGARDFLSRLQMLGDKPTIVFAFVKAHDVAAPPLMEAGFSVFGLPGPYAASNDWKWRLFELRQILGVQAKS